MLSKKTQYAFQALRFLTEHYEEGPVLISLIARKKKIPLKFLENILLELKHAGILDSKKGKGGGYFLRKDPGEVSIASVMRLMNGPIALLPCASLYFYERCKGCDEKSCGLHDMMVEVRDATLSIVENRSLRDLVSVRKDRG